MTELLQELPGGAWALFTTRANGNLSSRRGAGREQAEDARLRLARLHGLEGIARGRQVHGSRVRSVARADEAAGPLEEADGQATAERRLGAMVLTADCLPVALGSPVAVAMLHAGWRGLAAGVLEEGVRALRELADGGSMVAVVGPGAGPCCYEVGPEVHGALGSAADGRRGNIDLPALARERLLAAGVTEVRVLEACTICDGRFFSHRREGLAAGRQAGIAWLR